MKFRDKPDIDKTIFASSHRQWISEGGLWLVSLDEMFFGIRCNVSRASDHHLEASVWRWPGIALAYCCGLNPAALMLVPRVVMKALEPIATDAPESAVDHFPLQTIKPMHNDPECWRQLCELAGVAELGSIDVLLQGKKANDRLQEQVEAFRFATMPGPGRE